MAGGQTRVVIPYAPRPQFAPFHERRQRWGCLVCHRRAGKTVATINDDIREALRSQKSDWRGAYIAPFYAQAKDVAWDYVKRFSAPIPGVSFNESELRVDYPNGARYRLYGADNYDRMRGIYLDHASLDEYGDMDPRAWSEVIRPALADRKGSATFIGTPKGDNHFREVFDRAGDDPEWFRLVLKASETRLIDAGELAAAKREMTDDQYQQEFECSFSAGVVGAYYARDMQTAEEEGRVTVVAPERGLQVHTAWDLGIDDATAIWMFQAAGREIRVVDYIEASGEALDYYARELQKRPAVWGEHILPHDAQVKELGTGRSRVETLEGLGLRNIRVLPAQRVEDGINAVRMILPQCWFDAKRCARGIQALRNYRREFDEKTKAFRQRPLHDWSSHAADAFRYLALGYEAPRKAAQLQLPNFGAV